MSDLTAFLKQNALPVENVKYVASKDFLIRMENLLNGKLNVLAQKRMKY